MRRTAAQVIAAAACGADPAPGAGMTPACTAT
jgi:hypothetical protein